MGDELVGETLEGRFAQREVSAGGWAYLSVSPLPQELLMVLPLSLRGEVGGEEEEGEDRGEERRGEERRRGKEKKERGGGGKGKRGWGKGGRGGQGVQGRRGRGGNRGRGGRKADRPRGAGAG